MQDQQKLLSQPHNIKGMEIKNKFVVAPLTRQRADPETGVPNDLMAEYYEQKSEFGLIITECCQISDLSLAFTGSGGIYSQEQADGWRKVTDRVHAKGSKIIIQIWHCGRAATIEQLKGKTPIAPSPIAIRTENKRAKTPHPVPKEMTKDDIKLVVQQFAQAAQFSKDAGFDGIELHGANGYLIDQFLRDGTNQRTDEYGGSIENRCRFLFEILEAVIPIWGSERVSLRMSPTGRYGDIYDSDPLKLLQYLLPELDKRNLQFLELKRHGSMEAFAQSNSQGEKDQDGRVLPQFQIPDFFKTLRPLYKGTLIANDGFNLESAEQIIRDGDADLVSFGVLSIGNPDLPTRYQNGWELNKQNDINTYFTPNAKGYTDYPLYQK